MEAIINAVVERTGLDRAVVTKAVPAVVEFLSERLPAGMGDMVANVAGGGEAGSGDVLDNLKGGLGGLLGG